MNASSVRILALHGFTGNGTDFDALRVHLPAHWQWCCPDLPGHGDNPLTPSNGRFTLEQHFALIDNALKAWRGDTAPIILLGYSLGGRIALQWAAAHASTDAPPIAALVLIGASPGIADAQVRAQRREADAALADAICRDGMAAFLDHWWRAELFAGLAQNLAPQKLAALREQRLRNVPEKLAASLRGVGAGELPPLWENLPALHLPVLCAAGANDKKFRAIANEMASLLPSATTAFIEDAFHTPHLEKPKSMAAALAHAEASGLWT